MEDAERVRVVCSATPTAVLAQLRSGELTVETVGYHLEVCGLPVKVMPSLSSVCLDLPSIPLIVRHNLVLSVLWSMLSTNALPVFFRELRFNTNENVFCNLVI